MHKADLCGLRGTFKDFDRLQSHFARPAQHFQPFELYTKQICVACTALSAVLIICKAILLGLRSALSDLGYMHSRFTSPAQHFQRFCS